MIRTLPFRARFGLGILLLLTIVAAAAPWIAPYSPLAVKAGPSIAPPSFAHPFGTDLFGRDVFSRVVFGARISVAVGLLATALVFVLGSLLGAIAAVAPRAAGEAIMRATDIILAFPVLVMAVALAALLKPGLGAVIAIIAIRYTPELIRVVYANVRAQYGLDYVTAGRAMGARTPRILLLHVAGNCLPPVLVFSALIMADAVVLEASLSFVGLGVQPPAPSWGNIIADGRELIFAGGWYVTFFAGMAIFTAVLALNLCAEAVSETMGAPVHARRLPLAMPSIAASEILVPPKPNAVLSVRNLSVRFPDSYGSVDLLAGISFDLAPGEVLGIVGESGCGKSMLSLAIMGLLPAGAELNGSITYKGRELTSLSARERRKIMGAQIGMVYQDALSSLNPGMTVRSALAQVARHGGRSPESLLEMVHLPRRVLDRYPNEISGGQRQRVLIALALARGCSVLIADEPTTALDVTAQAEIIALLRGLREELNLSVIFVSHDLSLLAGFADRIAVLYAGQLVECAPTRALVEEPLHPYTYGLIASVASLERRDSVLAQISGSVPPPAQFCGGCRFAARCANAQPQCAQYRPRFAAVSGDHYVACFAPVKAAVV